VFGLRHRALLLGIFMLLCIASPASATTGGAEFGTEPTSVPRELVPGTKAVLLEAGYAAAPADAPPEVQEAVWAANEIQDKPYVYGGGHGDFEDDGYDCSGTVSYALNAAGLLKRPRDSSGFMRFGASGKGDWITIYTNPGHAYVVIAGLRLDTSSAGDRESRGRGPRWRTTNRPQRGFKVRHPIGF
jgi:hypothetical protein